MNLADAAMLKTNQLLSLNGKCKEQKVKIMVDSGASQNFISQGFVKELGLKISKEGQNKIRLANGSIT